MLPNDKETLDAVMAVLNNANMKDWDKIAAVGVIYLKYLTQQQISQLPPTAPTA